MLFVSVCSSVLIVRGIRIYNKHRRRGRSARHEKRVETYFDVMNDLVLANIYSRLNAQERIRLDEVITAKIESRSPTQKQMDKNVCCLFRALRFIREHLHEDDDDTVRQIKNACFAPTPTRWRISSREM